MATDTDPDRILEIHKRMINKTVKVLNNNSSWVGRVVDVVDTENFAVSRNKDTEPQTVNIFDISAIHGPPFVGYHFAKPGDDNPLGTFT